MLIRRQYNNDETAPLTEDILSTTFTYIAKTMQFSILADMNHFRTNVSEEFILNKTLKNTPQTGVKII
jgi:hypothetical protein